MNGLGHRSDLHLEGADRRDVGAELGLDGLEGVLGFRDLDDVADEALLEARHRNLDARARLPDVDRLGL